MDEAEASAWLRAGRRLELRCPEEDVRFVRLPWGVGSARFEVDGHKVTATRTATFAATPVSSTVTRLSRASSTRSFTAAATV